MLKFKRCIVLFAVILGMCTTAYATSYSVTCYDVGWSDFTRSVYGYTKTLDQSYATVELTQGPLYGKDYVYVYVASSTHSDKLRSATVTYSLPCSKTISYENYYASTHLNASFSLYAKLQAYSYDTTVDVKGTMEP